METLNAISDLVRNSSSVVWKGVIGVWSGHGSSGSRPADRPLLTAAAKSVPMLSRKEVLLVLHASPWTRLAGLMGASAVAMGAYGAHGITRLHDPLNHCMCFRL